MKIAVFGWYGHNNAGDERIKFCLNHFLMNLGGISSIDFFDFHNEAIKGPTNEFNHYDLVIIGGGGLILSQHNYHDFILNIKTTIATVGISVETKLKNNPKRLVLALLEKSNFFFVRDQGSGKKIAPFDVDKKVRVSGDLTFLNPYHPIQHQKNVKIGLNLLPKPQLFKYSSLASPYLSFILRQFQRFGIKNLVKIFDPKDIILSLQAAFPLVPIPLYCDPQDKNVPIYNKNDVEFLKLYFTKVPNDFSSALMDECSTLVSMRLHASIFSVQKGIPVISFSYLPKNRNFMKEVGLEDFVLDSPNSANVLPLINQCLKKQNFLQKKMLAYTEKTAEIVQRDILSVINSL